MKLHVITTIEREIDLAMRNLTALHDILLDPDTDDLVAELRHEYPDFTIANLIDDALDAAHDECCRMPDSITSTPTV